MREFAYHVGEYGVAYREDTDEVVIKLREAFAELLSIDEQREKSFLTNWKCMVSQRWQIAQ